MKNIWQGFVVPLQGIKYLRSHPSLLVIATIPLVLNILTILGGLSIVFNNSHWVEALVNHFGFSAQAGWMFWLAHKALVVLGWMTLLLVTVITTYLVGQIIGSPFSSLLAERTLISCGALKDRPFEIKAWLKLSWQMLWVSIVKTGVFMVVGAILFLISLMPIFAFFVQLGILLMLAFDSCDFAFEALGLSFRERMEFFVKNFFYFLGLALALGIILLIPGLNFFIFPASVAGSSLMIAQIRKDIGHGN